MSNNAIIALVVAIFLLFCCVCLACAGVVSYFIISDSQVSTIDEPPLSLQETPTSTPALNRPTRQPSPQPATPAAGETPLATEASEPAAINPAENYEILKNVDVPLSDLISLAQRLEGKGEIQRTLQAPETALQPGAQKSFWLLNSDSNESFQVSASLRYLTEHTYFWIEDGVSYDQDDLKELADTFETEIYPTNREFFGSEWTPGVDNDPHIYILYAGGVGSTVAGYFSTGDEFPPEASENSNGHEMFVFNSDVVTISEEYVYTTLAHEFQHMIHWNIDRNEDLWLNEGFSELASFINGYDIGGHDWVFSNNPDMQLTVWATGDADTSPNYGAAFLFVNYFLNRFGENLTRQLVADGLNGLFSIDDLLAKANITDPKTSALVNADDLFADWTITNFLLDDKVEDGRYDYANYPAAPQVTETEQVSNCPAGLENRDVNQYGADYIRIDCSGDFTLHLEGSAEVKILPEDPHSGSFFFWSNQGDESDMTLTRTFDFTDQSGSLTLSYWTWYNLEQDFDYVYVLASEDGEKWQILTTPSGTAEDPSGNSYGWGYTGASGNGPAWIQEEVDLSQFAGKEVQLRFEYVTDAAINKIGLALDDVAIPEINYSADFETDAGGWEASGFVRIQNVLPQTFEISLIRVGQTTTVERINLSSDNLADISLQLGDEVDQAILVVSGSTRFTREKAVYAFSIQP